MHFVAVASSVRPRITLHALGCHVTKPSLTQQCVKWHLKATDPETALAIVRRDEDTDERGLTVTACPCCYEDDAPCPCCIGRAD